MLPGLLVDAVVRCLIYVRIGMDKDHDGHGVANQLAKLEKKAVERGWTVVFRLSDNDILAGPRRAPPVRSGHGRGRLTAARLAIRCLTRAGSGYVLLGAQRVSAAGHWDRCG